VSWKPRQAEVHPALVEKGQFIYTEGHASVAWREVLQPPRHLGGDAGYLIVVRGPDSRPLNYTARKQTVWVRDTEEGD
jgi:hypothetical protein